MNKNLFFLAVVILVLAGCRQRENVSQLKEINESLIKACELIADNNRFIYNEMDEKLVDPQTHDRALIWQPRAEVIKRRASAVKIYIDSMRAALMKSSDSLNNTDVGVVKHLFESTDFGDGLFNLLAMFKDSATVVCRTNEFVESQNMVEALKRDSIAFLKHIPLLINYKDTSVTNARSGYIKDWINKNFRNSSPMMAMLVLSKIDADIFWSENILIGYCNSWVFSSFCGYDNFWGIASLSSSCVKPGDTVVVTAGMGAFGDMMHPRISIDGEAMRLNNKKVAVYVFTANKKPGKYTVPVKLEYIQPDGTFRTDTKNLEYIITDTK